MANESKAITDTNNAESNSDRWWQFGGSNLQAVYGYGSEADADRYRDWLNAKRDIDCYQVEAVDADKAAWLDGCDEGADLSEELAEIRDAGE